MAGGAHLWYYQRFHVDVCFRPPSGFDYIFPVPHRAHHPSVDVNIIQTPVSPMYDLDHGLRKEDHIL